MGKNECDESSNGLICTTIEKVIVEISLEKEINKGKIQKILQHYANIHFVKYLDGDKKADFSKNLGLKDKISKLKKDGIVEKKHFKKIKAAAKSEALSDD